VTLSLSHLFCGKPAYICNLLLHPAGGALQVSGLEFVQVLKEENKVIVSPSKLCRDFVNWKKFLDGMYHWDSECLVSTRSQKPNDMNQ